MTLKFEHISPVISKLNLLYNDRGLDPEKKLSLIKFMRELVTQMEDIAVVSNGFYLKYALKGKDGQMIKHPFNIEYVRNQTFKDGGKEIIFIPITGKDENYTIELQYNTYLSTHKDACAFMEHTYTTNNNFTLKTDEIVKYRFSAADIEFLTDVGIVNDSTIILSPTISVIKN
jgi:hypothetical protein